MTTTQWLFHYKEIVRERNKKRQDVKDIIEYAGDMLDALLDRMDFLAMLVNPEKAGEVFAKMKSKEDVKKVESGEDELLNWYNDLDKIIPKTLTMKNKPKNNEDKFFLPKYQRKRKLGIEFKESDEKAGE